MGEKIDSTIGGGFENPDSIGFGSSEHSSTGTASGTRSETSSGTRSSTESGSQIEVVSSMGDGGLIPSPNEPKRGRGRPPGSTKKPGTVSTTTNTKKTITKTTDEEQTAQMISTLLSVSFSITAKRAGNHWLLSKEESEALAEPMAKIMARHNLTEKTGAYADYIALVLAVGMIIVPRLMTTMDNNKKKGGIQLVGKTNAPSKQTGSTGNISGTVRNEGTVNASNRPVQQSAPDYGSSTLTESIGWIG